MFENTWNVATRGMPFLLAALALAEIAVVTWAYTPWRRIRRDAISLSLIVLIVPLAVYLGLNFVGFTFHFSPDDLAFLGTRLVMAVGAVIALVGLTPLVTGAIRTRRRKKVWPKDLPPQVRDGLP